MHDTLHAHPGLGDVATAPSQGIALGDLITEVLVLLEASGEDRMAAMLCILGPAGETQPQAMRRLSTTLTRLRERSTQPAGNA